MRRAAQSAGPSQTCHCHHPAAGSASACPGPCAAVHRDQADWDRPAATRIGTLGSSALAPGTLPPRTLISATTAFGIPRHSCHLFSCHVVRDYQCDIGSAPQKSTALKRLNFSSSCRGCAERSRRIARRLGLYVAGDLDPMSRIDKRQPGVALNLDIDFCQIEPVGLIPEHPVGTPPPPMTATSGASLHSASAASALSTTSAPGAA